MLTDPIADMLTRIRNASMARHERVVMPISRMRVRIGLILKAEGYVDDVREGEGTLTLILRYGRDRRSAIDGLRRVSRPGRRVYVGNGGIPKVRNGLGISILSTSRGVMSDTEARTQHVGGELLCEVW